MYKCGWNGCEKAYGTLNHLNAHVTMQSHGQKRIPEGMLPSELISTPVFTTMRSWPHCDVHHQTASSVLQRSAWAAAIDLINFFHGLRETLSLPRFMSARARSSVLTISFQHRI